MSDLARVEQLTARVLDAGEDGALSEPEWVELRGLVAADPVAWDLYRRTLDTESVLRSMDLRVDLEDGVMAAIEEEFPLSEKTQRKVIKFSPRVIGGLATAAAIVLLIGIVVMLGRPGPPQGAIAESSGAVEISRDGRPFDLADGTALQAEDLIRVGAGGSITLGFKDDTQVEILASSEAIFSPDLKGSDKEAKRFELIAGSLVADVSPQDPDHPLVVKTRHARAVVRGTRFRLRTDERRSLLSVESGTVDLVSNDGQVVSVAAGESASAEASSSTGPTKRPRRCAQKPIAFYLFNTGGGEVVQDRSPLPPELDLASTDREIPLLWQPDGLRFDGATFLTSNSPATDLIEACQQSGEVSFEVWITPAADRQGGPARLVTLTRGSTPNAIMLAQGQYRVAPAPGYVVRTPTDDPRGLRRAPLSVATSPATLTHLVFTHASDGKRAFYVNGELADSDVLPGGFSNWLTGLPLSVGGDLEGEHQGGQKRTWQGVFHLLAIFPSALSAEDVRQNFHAGAP